MNLSKLAGKMAERGYTRRRLSEEAEITYHAWCNKLNGMTDMTIPEGLKIRDVLKMTDDEAIEIFLR